MKKLLSLVLALTMALSLAACGSGAQETGTPTDAAQTPTDAAVDYANSTVILYTGNVRGNVEVYARIAAARAAYEEKGAAVYLVDAGNYLQGTAYANSDRGLTVCNLMDAAGYDVAAMGLYEFVYGGATTGNVYHANLTRYFTQAELLQGTPALEYRRNSPRADEAVMGNREAKDPASFAVVCSNLTAGDDATGYYAFAPNAVLGDSLKVGFVSAVPENVTDFIQDGYLDGYSFGTVSAPECDILVALGSGQGDIVIEAPVGGQPVTGAYVIDNTTKAITAEAVDMTGTDAQVEALIEAAQTAPVVGTSQVILDGSDRANRNGQTNLGKLTADALLWYAENKAEGLRDVPVAAIQNGGNCDQFLYDGDITEVDLLNALPFSPMGVGIVYVTGAQLLETLEAATQCADCPGWAQVAGLAYTVDTAAAYDAGEAYGDFFKASSIRRVTVTSVGGEAFDENATYAIIADNFLLNGNDTYYTFGAIKEAGEDYVQLSTFGGLKTRDIVALYIGEALGGTVDTAYAQYLILPDAG